MELEIKDQVGETVEHIEEIVEINALFIMPVIDSLIIHIHEVVEEGIEIEISSVLNKNEIPNEKSLDKLYTFAYNTSEESNLFI